MGFRSLREQSLEDPVCVPLHQAEDSIWMAVFDRPTEFNGVGLGEDITQGQRVGGFRIEAWKEEGWTTIAQGTTIGRKRIILVETMTTERVRVFVTSFLATPRFAQVRVYRVPPDLHSALRADL
jgi:hypothetical protein